MFKILAKKYSILRDTTAESTPGKTLQRTTVSVNALYAVNALKCILLYRVQYEQYCKSVCLSVYLSTVGLCLSRPLCLPVINQTFVRDRVFQMFRTVAHQIVISRYNYRRERSQSRKYSITVFYQCINQKGPSVLQAIFLVHLLEKFADIRRQFPFVLSKKKITRMYQKICKINQEIPGNPKIRQGIYSGVESVGMGIADGYL